MYNADSDAKQAITISTYEELVDWMNDHGFALKQLLSIRDRDDELQRTTLLYYTVKEYAPEDFLEKYTMFAFYKGIVNDKFLIQEFEDMPCIVYKKHVCDLRTFEMGTLEPMTVFKKLYSKMHTLISFLHKHEIFYGDMRCANIYVVPKESDVDKWRFVVGNYRAIRNADMPFYKYTYPSPTSNTYFKFWVEDARRTCTFYRLLSPEVKKTLFGIDRVLAVHDAWKNLSYVGDAIEVARDWWHFGICMIEFIAYMQQETLYPLIEPIFMEFCARPKVTDRLMDI